jgi:hypothetical protein
MATTFATIDKSTALDAQDSLRIIPTEVHVDTAFNSRTKLDERKFKAMKEDVRVNGIKSPVLLYLSDGSEGQPEVGTPVLVFGFTRTRIAKELYEESGGDERYLLPYTLLDHVPTKAEALTLNATENFQRSDLTTWDTVMLIKRFEEEHGIRKSDELAKVFGKSSAWVTQHKKLGSALHPEIQKRLNLHPEDKGYIPGSVAMELAAIEDQDEQLSILKGAELEGSGVATRDSVKKKVSEAAEEGRAPIKAKTIKQLQAFLDSLTTPPVQMDGEEDDQFESRRQEFKSDPLVPFGKKFSAYIAGRTTEKAFLKFLRSAVVTVEKS